MASTSSLSPCGAFHEIEGSKRSNSYSSCCADRFSIYGDSSLPILNSTDYYTVPSLEGLCRKEHIDPGYCSQVPDFEIGRVAYGRIRFMGFTDIRWINLDETVNFSYNSVTVYKDEVNKPPLGHGLNKPAEVTLILHPRLQTSSDSECLDLENKLKACNEKQGARFISFDSSNGEWRFMVDHFSRFGLDDLDEDEEDEEMDNFQTRPISIVNDPISNDGYGSELSHSLPANLRLDPVKMQETRMLMLSDLDEEEDFRSPLTQLPSNRKYNLNPATGRKKALDSFSPTVKGKGLAFGSPVKGLAQQSKENFFSPSTSKSPTQPLLEYNVGKSDLSPSSSILLTGQNKGPPMRLSKVVGFKLEEEHLHETPVSCNTLTNCVVDAALFMGQSFRVGWGPNGLLLHSGCPVRDQGWSLSSVIHIERVASDRAARDKNGVINKELVDLCFSSPMEFHKSLPHEFEEIESGSHKLTLYKVVADRSMLQFICRSYVEILEKQHGVNDFPNSSRTLMVHTISVWELIRVLFFEGDTTNTQLDLTDDDMVLDAGTRGGPHEPDEEALPFAHRAGFSYWLQESVVNRVDEDINCLTDNSYLEQILVLLTGRQLDQAVELAVSRGDVRLGILISQAGGSIINRSDMSQQLDLWRINGLDFDLIEQDRLKIYELLSGNVHTALQDQSIDWKRYLGLILWYKLAPDTTIPVVINTYQQLLNEGKVPYPVPVYIDEGPLDEAPITEERFDMLYYLMLLHANNEEEGLDDLVKAMLSALSSSHDPLDHHMIWHQRSVLEAIGVVESTDLHLLDMSFVNQLLGLGLCHWAIYVVMHMPCVPSVPYFHEKVVREVLLQHVELWSRDDVQRKFLEEHGVPSEWMHEALAIYYEYNGDKQRALENYIGCANWRRAHSIFMTLIAHALFLNGEHSEIWRITSSMEAYKDEISDWDLGAGIYLDFYDLRSSMKEEVIMSDTDLLEKRNEACKSLFDRLNDSLIVWGARFPVEARATYSKMAEELNSLLVSTPAENSTPDVQMSCFDTMLGAPLPEDQRSTHLQEAISVFTYLLSDDSGP
ncbi:nuclear pore complex protein Nup96 isoform X1 [Carex littledalei]|uniref:Nuclear pore complex protein Nup96 isoform X1 n=1 Tax=Carex littledalei TaxID=544730 RepID=A0A833QHG9_9POAL|nr:nuclear pore complex protein Nup96 isoform X1 [Carex littledalei]